MPSTLAKRWQRDKDQHESEEVGCSNGCFVGGLVLVERFSGGRARAMSLSEVVAVQQTLCSLIVDLNLMILSALKSGTASRLTRKVSPLSVMTCSWGVTCRRIQRWCGAY